MFWSDVLEAWCRYNYSECVDNSQISNQYIWLNSHIRVNNQVINNKNCLTNGLLKLHDIYLDGILLDITMINI